MSDDAGERNLPPSFKRRQEAAKQGDVLRSREVATAAGFGAGALCFLVLGSWLATELQQVLRTALTFDAADLAAFEPQQAMLRLLVALLPPLLILGGVVAITTAAVQLASGEGRFLLSNLAPKFMRLNPLSGLKRMLGMHGLIELGKSLLKLTLVGAITWWWVAANLLELLAIGRASLEQQVAVGWNAISSLLLYLAAGLTLIAAADWPIEWLRRNKRLMMTQQEARDEHKESEGSPEKKSALRQRQRSLARGGVSKAVQEADFVLVNPAHFAVALVYDSARASAPILLAKGRDEKAFAMRELAAEYGKPVLEYPVLARSVYFTTQENQMVREELYAAIATVLAFVMSLKRGEKRMRPMVHVPDSVRYDTAGQLSRA